MENARDLLVRVYHEKCAATGTEPMEPVLQWLRTGALQSFRAPHNLWGTGIGARQLDPLLETLDLIPLEELAIEDAGLQPPQLARVIAFAQAKGSLRALLLRRNAFNAALCRALLDAIAENASLTSVLVDATLETPVTLIDQACFANLEKRVARGAGDDTVRGARLGREEVAALKAHMKERFDRENAVVGQLAGESAAGRMLPDAHPGQASVAARVATGAFSLGASVESFPVDLSAVAATIRECLHSTFPRAQLSGGIPWLYFFFVCKFTEHTLAHTGDSGAAFLSELAALNVRFRQWRAETWKPHAPTLSHARLPRDARVVQAAAEPSPDEALHAYLMQLLRMLDGPNAVWAEQSSTWLHRFVREALEPLVRTDDEKIGASARPWPSRRCAKRAARSVFWTSCGRAHGLAPRRHFEDSMSQAAKTEARLHCVAVGDVAPTSRVAQLALSSKWRCGGGAPLQFTDALPMPRDAPTVRAQPPTLPASLMAAPCAALGRLNISPLVAAVQSLQLRHMEEVDVVDLLLQIMSDDSCCAGEEFGLLPMFVRIIRSGYRTAHARGSNARVHPALCCTFDVASNAATSATPFDLIADYTEFGRQWCRGTCVVLGIKVRPQWAAAMRCARRTVVLAHCAGEDGASELRGGFPHAVVICGTRQHCGVVHAVALMNDLQEVLLHPSVVNDGVARYGAAAFVDVSWSHYDAIMRRQRAPGLARQLPSFPTALAELPVSVELALMQVRTLPGLHPSDEALRAHTPAKHNDRCRAIVESCLSDAGGVLWPSTLLTSSLVEQGLRLYRMGGGGAAALRWWSQQATPIQRLFADAARKIFAARCFTVHPLLCADLLPPYCAEDSIAAAGLPDVFFPVEGVTDVLVNGRCTGDARGLLLGTERVSFSRIWDSSSVSPHGRTPTILVDAGRSFAMCSVAVTCAVPAEIRRDVLPPPGQRAGSVAHVEVSFSDDGAAFTALQSFGVVNLHELADRAEESRDVSWSFGNVGRHRFWRIRLFIFDDRGRPAEPQLFAPEVCRVQWSYTPHWDHEMAVAPYGDNALLLLLPQRAARVLDASTFAPLCVENAICGRAHTFLACLGLGAAPIRAFLRYRQALHVFFGHEVVAVDSWSGQPLGAPVSIVEHLTFRHLPEPFRSTLTGTWALTESVFLLLSGYYFCVFDLESCSCVVPPTVLRGQLPGRPSVETDERGNQSQVQLKQNGVDPYTQWSFPFDTVDVVFSAGGDAGRLIFTSGDHYVIWLLPTVDSMRAAISSRAVTGFPDAPVQSIAGSLFAAATATSSVSIAQSLAQLRQHREKSAASVLQPIGERLLQDVVAFTHRGKKSVSVKALLCDSDGEFGGGAAVDFGGEAQCEVQFTYAREVCADAVEIVAEPCGTTWSWQYCIGDGRSWVEAAAVVQLERASCALAHTHVRSRLWRLTSGATTAGKVARVIPHKHSLSSEVGGQYRALPGCASSQLAQFASFSSTTSVDSTFPAVPGEADGVLAVVGIEITVSEGDASLRDLVVELLDHEPDARRTECDLLSTPSATLSPCCRLTRFPIRLICSADMPTVRVRTHRELNQQSSFGLRWLTVPVRAVAAAVRRRSPRHFVLQATEMLAEDTAIIASRCRCVVQAQVGAVVAALKVKRSDTAAASAAGTDIAASRSGPLDRNANCALNFTLRNNVAVGPAWEFEVMLSEPSVLVEEATFYVTCPRFSRLPLLRTLNGFSAAPDADLPRLWTCETVRSPVLIQQQCSALETPLPYLELLLPPGVTTSGVRVTLASTGPSHGVRFRALARVAQDAPWSAIGDGDVTVMWPAMAIEWLRLEQVGPGVAHIAACEILEPPGDAAVRGDAGVSASSMVAFGGREVVLPSLDNFRLPLRVGTELTTRTNAPVEFCGVAIVGMDNVACSVEFAVQVLDAHSPPSWETIASVDRASAWDASWAYWGSSTQWRLVCVRVDWAEDAADVPETPVLRVSWRVGPAACVVEPFFITPEAGSITSNAYVRADASAPLGGPNRWLHELMSRIDVGERTLLRFAGPFEGAALGCGRSQSSAASAAVPSVMYVAVDLGTHPQAFVRLGIHTDDDAEHELCVQYSDDGVRYTSVAVHQQRDNWCFSSWPRCRRHRFWRVVVNVVAGAMQTRKSRRSNASSHAEDDDVLIREMLQPARSVGFSNLVWFVHADHRPSPHGFAPSAAAHKAILGAMCLHPLTAIPNADPALLRGYPVGLGLARRPASWWLEGGVCHQPPRHDTLVRLAHGRVSATAIRGASSLEERMDECLPHISRPEGLVEPADVATAFVAEFFGDDQGALIINDAVVTSELHKFTSTPTVTVCGALGAPFLRAAAGTPVAFAVEFVSGSTSSTVSYVLPQVALHVARPSVCLSEALGEQGRERQLPFSATADFLVCFATRERLFGGLHPPLPRLPKAPPIPSDFEVRVPRGVSAIAVSQSLAELERSFTLHHAPQLRRDLLALLGSLDDERPIAVAISQSEQLLEFVVAPLAETIEGSSFAITSPVRVTVSLRSETDFHFTGAMRFPSLLGSATLQFKYSSTTDTNNPDDLLVGCSIMPGVDGCVMHLGHSLSHIVGSVAFSRSGRGVNFWTLNGTLWLPALGDSMACSLVPAPNGAARTRGLVASARLGNLGTDGLLAPDFRLLDVVVDTTSEPIDDGSTDTLKCKAMMMWNGALHAVSLSIRQTSVLIRCDALRHSLHVAGGLHLPPGSRSSFSIDTQARKVQFSTDVASGEIFVNEPSRAVAEVPLNIAPGLPPLVAQISLQSVGCGSRIATWRAVPELRLEQSISRAVEEAAGDGLTVTQVLVFYHPAGHFSLKIAGAYHGIPFTSPPIPANASDSSICEHVAAAAENSAEVSLLRKHLNRDNE